VCPPARCRAAGELIADLARTTPLTAARHGAQQIVVVGARNAEQRHHLVADGLVDVPPCLDDPVRRPSGDSAPRISGSNPIQAV
jgi:hypothetical protein